jgi:hypothetical protein
LQKKAAAGWTTEILPDVKTNETIRSGPATPLPQAVTLFAVDRYGNMSSGAIYRAAQ